MCTRVNNDAYVVYAVLPYIYSTSYGIYIIESLHLIALQCYYNYSCPIIQTHIYNITIYYHNIDILYVLHILGMNHFVRAPRHTRARATHRTPPPQSSTEAGRGCGVEHGRTQPPRIVLDDMAYLIARRAHAATVYGTARAYNCGLWNARAEGGAR